MKKPSASKKATSPAKTKPDGLTTLLTEVRQLIQSARRGVSTVVDTFQVMTNFEIGRRIVEHEQKGAKRAAYGAELLKELSARLTEEFGRGFSKANLEYMRRFYLEWESRVPQIAQTASGQFDILQQPIGKLAIAQTASGQLVPTSIRQTPSGKSPFTLSWSHYVVLMTIKDPDERSFYEIESRQADWDVRELKRQKASCLYERLALSRDKEGIRRLAKEGQIITRPEDLLKEPLVLEFLGLDEKTSYTETDLEHAIIGRLEHFLLEIGKGFLFEARQKRFTFDEDHYFVDLVFYRSPHPTIPLGPLWCMAPERATLVGPRQGPSAGRSGWISRRAGRQQALTERRGTSPEGEVCCQVTGSLAPATAELTRRRGLAPGKRHRKRRQQSEQTDAGGTHQARETLRG